MVASLLCFYCPPHPYRCEVFRTHTHTTPPSLLPFVLYRPCHKQSTHIHRALLLFRLLFRLLFLRQASQEEIHGAYIGHARVFHPDKAKFAAQENQQDGGGTLQDLPEGVDATSIFSLLAHAYAELSDPVKRSLYDMVNGFKDRDDDQLHRMALLKKEEADRAIDLMQVTVMSKRAEEMVKGGLVVQSACYGSLPPVLNMDEPIEAQAYGNVVDVSIPVQCLVEESQLHMEGGESKVWEVGFYDPDVIDAHPGNRMPEAPPEDRRLAVRYFFRGVLHQVVVNDRDELRAPMRAHLPSKGGPMPAGTEASMDAAAAAVGGAGGAGAAGVDGAAAGAAGASSGGSTVGKVLRGVVKGTVYLGVAAGLAYGAAWVVRTHGDAIKAKLTAMIAAATAATASSSEAAHGETASSSSTSASTSSTSSSAGSIEGTTTDSAASAMPPPPSSSSSSSSFNVPTYTVPKYAPAAPTAPAAAAAAAAAAAEATSQGAGSEPSLPTVRILNFQKLAQADPTLGEDLAKVVGSFDAKQQ